MPYGTPEDQYPNTQYYVLLQSSTEITFRAEFQFRLSPQPGVFVADEPAADAEFQKFVDMIDSSTDFEFVEPPVKRSHLYSEVTST